MKGIVRNASAAMGLAVAMIFCAITGCAKEKKENKTCVDEVCVPGSQVCFGHYAATCNDDGKSYRREHCGPSKRCEAGACVVLGTDGCKPGNRICTTAAAPWRYDECPEAGTGMTPGTCPADNTCDGGVCLPDQCSVGAAACGWKSGWSTLLLRCETGNSWVHSDCPSGQVCKPRTGCIAQECTALETECTGPSQRRVCAVGGYWQAPESCDLGQYCYDGLCLPEVCGVTPTIPPSPEVAEVSEQEPDAASPEPDAAVSDQILDIATDVDGLTVPDLEQLATASVRMDTVFYRFTANLAASYLASRGEWQQVLQITMDEGPRKIEIHLSPITDGTTGEFGSDLPASSVSVYILYNDGSYFSPAGGPASFPWASVPEDFHLRLTRFGALGDWVEGTFEGLLRDQVHEAGFDRPDIRLTDGYFRVRRTL